MRRSGLVVTVAAVLASSMPGLASADEGVDTAAVDRFVADFADNAAYPGVAVAITKGDRVAHVSGYGARPGGLGGDRDDADADRLGQQVVHLAGGDAAGRGGEGGAGQAPAAVRPGLPDR